MIGSLDWKWQKSIKQINFSNIIAEKNNNDRGTSDDDKDERYREKFLVRGNRSKKEGSINNFNNQN